MAQTSDLVPVSSENLPSASALNVARCRAIAAHDPRVEIQGADVLAECFLDDQARQSLRDPATHALILKKLDVFSPGSYEYFIARTAYLDSVVKQALQDNIPQIVFLGAGYDTRSYRFSHLIRDTRIFELDTYATQHHKRGLLEQAQVVVPPQLTFVAIDFNQDSLAEALSQAGYTNTKQTLFLWEGVSYYLPPQTVEDTFSFVRRDALAGTIICFDYMLPTLDLENRFGAKQAREAMQGLYTAEPLQFDLAEEQLTTFLAERGFELIDHLTAEDMQARYLTLSDGSLAGRMLDLFRLVQARVTTEG